MKIINNILSAFFILLIKFYRYFISPLTKSSCRFSPTCSEYAIIAIKTHGILIGSFLAFKRILKCNPFGGVGLDNVPNKFRFKKSLIKKR